MKACPACHHPLHAARCPVVFQGKICYCGYDCRDLLEGPQ